MGTLGGLRLMNWSIDRKLNCIDEYNSDEFLF